MTYLNVLRFTQPVIQALQKLGLKPIFYFYGEAILFMII